MFRIVLADDHAIVRTGFRALIEQEPDMRIIAECSNADEAYTAVIEQKPDVLALDLSMPGGGLALVSRLQTSAPDLLLLVLSMHDREPYISEALRRGVHGYVTKGAATDELVAALRVICAGGTYTSSDVRQAARTPDSGLERLSEREREVFLLLAHGATPKQVASNMGISDKTAYLHRTAVRAKLGARSDLDLHQIALERGLL
jgi:DNA-binding NarL/FixJ family response regulator